jgi:F-type H+-transporting ATPase subunit a
MRFTKLAFITSYFLLLFILSNPLQAIAAGDEHNAHETTAEAFRPGEMIISHIVDSYDWHIADIGHTHITMPLPVILFDDGQWHFFLSSRFEHGHATYKGFELAKEGAMKGKIVKTAADGTQIRPYDFSITKTVFGSFVTSIILILIFISVAKSYKKTRNHAPKGFQSLIEPLILFVRDEIAFSSIGKKHYEKFSPFLLSIFFFIFFNNLLGLVPIFPLGANITGNIAVTGVLALFTFGMILVSGNKNYWAHIFNTPGVPWWLKLPLPLMPIIELVGVFTKPFVLMIRLFANITAGHIIILGFISLIFVFGQTSLAAGYGISVLSVAMSIFISFLELLVAFIQAYVFTLLSAIFIGMAVEEHHHEETHETHHE